MDKLIEELNKDKLLHLKNKGGLTRRKKLYNKSLKLFNDRNYKYVKKLIDEDLFIHPNIMLFSYSMFNRINDVNKLCTTYKYNIVHLNYALFVASREGHTNICKALIKYGADDIDLSIMTCYAYNKLSTAKNIINTLDKTKINDIFVYICKYDEIELAKILINKGADDIYSGILNACENRNVKLVKFLYDKNKVNLTLCFISSIIGGNLELIKFFYNKGAKDNNLGSYTSVIHGKPLALSYFIEKGIDNKKYLSTLTNNILMTSMLKA